MRSLAQVFIEHSGGAVGEKLERELFIVRKLIEREKASLGAVADDFYVCSLSNKTIVYKVGPPRIQGLIWSLRDWSPNRIISCTVGPVAVERFRTRSKEAL